MASTSLHNRPNGSSASSAHFDPKALLNPKSYKAGKDKKEPANSYSSPSNAALLLSPGSHKAKSASSISGDSDAAGLANGGQGSIIERMHRVERREDRPIKRQKKRHDGDAKDEDGLAKKKLTSGPIASSGEMGTYLKEQRREALEKQGPPKLVVDLTDGECLFVNIQGHN